MQKYCPEPLCRLASKKASQQRWLQKPENQDYFRGPQHVSRVQAWREQRPDYEQKAAAPRQPLQETIMGQLVEVNEKSTSLRLQETIGLKPVDAAGESGLWAAGALQDSM
jgi:hypothetical protein